MHTNSELSWTVSDIRAETPCTESASGSSPSITGVVSRWRELSESFLSPFRGVGGVGMIGSIVMKVVGVMECGLISSSSEDSGSCSAAGNTCRLESKGGVST